MLGTNFWLRITIRSAKTSLFPLISFYPGRTLYQALVLITSQIVALNDAVQKVKADQTTLEQELEFIATQHAELEESIAPLQKEFMNMPQVDIERTQT